METTTLTTEELVAWARPADVANPRARRKVAIELTEFVLAEIQRQADEQGKSPYALVGLMVETPIRIKLGNP